MMAQAHRRIAFSSWEPFLSANDGTRAGQGCMGMVRTKRIEINKLPAYPDLGAWGRFLCVFAWCVCVCAFFLFG